MRKIGTLVFAVLLAGLLGRSAEAQQATVVSGTVTSGASAPVAGASVAITALGLGAITDPNGRYSFVVPAARAQGQTATIIARRIGFRQSTTTVTLTEGAVTVDFALVSAPTQLEEVVTTALGIEASKKSLGYSQQSVDSSMLTRTRALNIASTLSGKVAGLTVTGATTQGGSARVVIRGAASITGNNEPLYVIDGIPINNSNFTNNSQQRGYGGYDYGNAAQDINPDDIAELSVLKGATAAAIYGSRAANGAILITTKTGKSAKGFSWNASTNVTYDKPLRLPDYQNTWGQGSGGALCDKSAANYAKCGFSFVDGNYGGVNDGVDESWGPRMDGTPRLQFSLTNPGVGELRPWVAHPDNVSGFFNTGRTAIGNIATQGANDRANFRLSLTRQDVQGIVPNNQFQRTTGTLNAGATVTPRLSASGNISYIKNAGQNRPGTGYDEANPMMGFVWFGRQVDVAALKTHYTTADGQQISWNYSYHNNPYWNQYENSNRDDRDRVTGSAQLMYTFAPWLKGMVRSGTDFYRDYRDYQLNAGWIGGLFDGGSYSQGGFQEVTRFNRETNSDFLLSANQSFMGGVLGAKVDVGGNRRFTHYRANAFGTDKLVVPGVYNIANSAKPVIPAENLAQRQVNSLYGQGELSYNDYLFLKGTVRNDWSSTLPKRNNSYLYPSASVGFVFTEAAPMLSFGNTLNYGKLRAGWSRVGSDNQVPYQLRPTFTPGVPFESDPTFSVNDTLPNEFLKPEQTQEVEGGVELQFLQNRLGFDVTYYNKATTNQILQADVSRASGFTKAVVNAGKVSNRGIEAQFTAMPLDLANGFRWTVTTNYAKNKSKVEELYGNLQTVVLGPSHWGVTIEARKGETFGAIYGNPYKRNAQGQLLLRNGLPQPDATKRVLGHYPPDWTGSINNEMRYHNFDVSFMFDTRRGGNIYSTGNMWAAYSGQLKETENRPAAGILISGVDEASGSVNSTRVQTEDYYHSLWKIQERWVYDASFVKFRELRLGYSFPSSLSERFGVSALKGAIVGRNLALWAKAPNIDPETAFSTQNEQGLEMGQLPSTRSIGFQISVTP